jgi:hypothetical protein
MNLVAAFGFVQLKHWSLAFAVPRVGTQCYLTAGYTKEEVEEEVAVTIKSAKS